MLDLIDDNLVVFVDNAADHASVIPSIINSIEKTNILFVISERSYRQNFVENRISEFRYVGVYGDALSANESKSLISKYFKEGVLGDGDAIKKQGNFIKKISGDPIAIACCRILNDFRPFDRIISSFFDEVDGSEIDAYIYVAVASDCVAAGLSYAILNGIVGGGPVKKLFDGNHPLSFSYSELGKNYIVPENRAISGALLKRYSEDFPDKIFTVFERLSRAIASRVTPLAIRRRTPEARLAATLLDLDLKVEPFLGDKAFDLYLAIQDQWEWNSRYWCQRALLKHQEFLANPTLSEAYDILEQAIGHARQAVSIEHHPLTLTTLGRMLLSEIEYFEGNEGGIFSEAFGRLTDAIDQENRQRRNPIQPFIVLFKGVRNYLEQGYQLTERQSSELEELIKVAKRKFRENIDIVDLISNIELR
jgi:hypothetical protein